MHYRNFNIDDTEESEWDGDFISRTVADFSEHTSQVNISGVL